ncbi:MAG: DUF4332 domain-containing protein [Pirellulaceae bacterium]
MRKLIMQWFKRSSSGDQATAPQSRSVPLTPRQRKLNASLGTLRLLSPALKQVLKRCQIETVADLLKLRASHTAAVAHLTSRQWKQLRRIQQALRLSLQIRRMHPRDAIVLLSIHRTSIAIIAADSPKHLYRDIQRFALSSRGERLIARMGMPTREQVAAWIEAARALQSKQTMIRHRSVSSTNQPLCPRY